MEDLDPGAEALGEGGEAHRHHHELLEVHRVVSVGTAVDDVHHRHRQLSSATAAKVLVERETAAFGRRVGGGERYREHGIGAHGRLVVGPIGVDETLINAELVACVEILDRFGERAVDVLNRAQHSLATETIRVAVAKLEGFTGTGGRAGRRDGAADGTAGKNDLCLDRWIAAGVENFPAANEFDIEHNHILR